MQPHITLTVREMELVFGQDEPLDRFPEWSFWFVEGPLDREKGATTQNLLIAESPDRVRYEAIGGYYYQGGMEFRESLTFNPVPTVFINEDGFNWDRQGKFFTADETIIRRLQEFGFIGPND